MLVPSSHCGSLARSGRLKQGNHSSFLYRDLGSLYEKYRKWDQNQKQHSLVSSSMGPCSQHPQQSRPDFWGLWSAVAEKPECGQCASSTSASFAFVDETAG